MSDISKFESRTGKLSCKPAEVFDFVTDIRNFRQFVPDGTVNELQIERESCSFKILHLGSVKLNISEKEPHSKVTFAGTALQSNDFSLILYIKENNTGKADVKIELSAELNPVLKMMAAKPVDSFLEKLVEEMEKNQNWKSTK